MTLPKPLTRFQAAGIHLGISAAIAMAVLLVMLLLWYPPPLFSAMGGNELIVLLVGVDVVIGPLITLIVYANGKKSLRADLATIATLQLAALAYGVHAMYEGRPVFIVFVERRLSVVPAAEVDVALLAQARPEFRSLSKTGPILVAVDMPTDPKEIEWVLLAGLGGGGAQHLPQHYVPYAERLERALAVARPLAQARNLTVDEQAILNHAIQRSGIAASELRFLPVTTRRLLLTALIDAKTGQIIELLAVNPVRQAAPGNSPGEVG